ncbi:uncharacterized protein LOC135394852 [Ornithodoros turicata]|uniref:uncharacterized protein LOC135394852 n=1 Tax=Ornithodoros turicata TaxID=34597 RepID=UPI003139D5FE
MASVLPPDSIVCSGSEDIPTQSGTLLGVVLAIANVFFNSSSFVIKKYGLGKLSMKYDSIQLRFLLDPVWLSGAALGTLGDVAQGLALQFTSSTLVVALGMANGLVTAVLMVTVLNEPTSVLVVSVCLLTVAGTVLMVLGVPSEMEPMTAMELELFLMQTGFLVYALLMGIAMALAAGLIWQSKGNDCILVHIFISSCSSVPYTIAVKAIVMTVAEIGGIFSPRTAVWILVVMVSFVTHVIFLNKGLEYFDPVRISQLSSCFLNLCFTTTMMVLSRSWLELTPYHGMLLLFGMFDIAIALAAFVIFQDDHHRSDASVKIALRILFRGTRLGPQPTIRRVGKERRRST